MHRIPQHPKRSRAQGIVERIPQQETRTGVTLRQQNEAPGRVGYDPLRLEDPNDRYRGISTQGTLSRTAHRNFVAQSALLPLGPQRIRVVDVRAGQVLQVIIAEEPGAILSDCQ
jgi:hypothetical protein